jgi:chorismate-pyruvate lyase
MENFTRPTMQKNHKTKVQKLSVVETPEAIENKNNLESYLDFSSLSSIQKILLKTDGTVTLLLELWLSESIRLTKLSERVISLEQNNPSLGVPSGERVLERKILLQGETSKKNLVYAESLIVLNRLEKNFATKLLNTEETIGKLWINSKLETFREILSITQEQAGSLANYFNIESQDLLMSRTYRIFSNKTPIMLITEKFPKIFLQ